MSLYPCSACGQRDREKRINITWAWNLPDNQRIAYRQNLCTGCAGMILPPLEVAADTEPFRCPMCHTDPEDDMDPIYATYYLPRVGKVQLELATCSACAVDLRTKCRLGAALLEDRPADDRAGGPQTLTSADVWRSLGIEPR